MLIIKRNLTEQSSILNLKNPIIFDLTKPPDIHMYEYFDSIHFFLIKTSLCLRLCIMVMHKLVFLTTIINRLGDVNPPPKKINNNSLELPYGQLILKRTSLNSFFLAHDWGVNFQQNRFSAHFNLLKSSEFRKNCCNLTITLI